MNKKMNKSNLSPASTLQQPKVIPVPVPVPQQPKAIQVPAPQQSKVSPVSSPRQIQDIFRSRSTPTVTPTHDDIAKRAYEIYTQKGNREGDSEQNWKQAEQELRT